MLCDCGGDDSVTEAALPAVKLVAQSAVPAAVTQKLPDLFPIASQSQGYIYDYTLDRTEEPGHTLLRFSTAMANKGVGPLELRGGTGNAATGTQEVFQRIYNSDGTASDRTAGYFTYHPAHGHIHFDGFAAYNLRQVTADNGVGDIVGTGDKISFCLLDIAHFDATLAGSPSRATYASCGQLQGISVGWNDIYDRDLPDQWIDVTNVPDGKYWLEVIADPDNRIQESDETDNTARIMIDLNATSTPLAADRFEPNDSFAAAKSLGTLGRRIETGLSVHKANNDDYYKFTAASTATAVVDLGFDASKGDLDLYVYNSSQTLLEESELATDSEHVEVNVEAGKTYYVKVVGFQGATNPAYDLTIDAPQTVTLTATDSSASEPGGSSGNTGLFTVSRNGQSNQPLTVNYTVTGTATNGTDYELLSGTVVLSVLNTSQTIKVTVKDDTVQDANETVTVTLKSSSDYAVGSASSATVTIADNDNPDAHDQISEAYSVSVGGNSGQKTLGSKQVHMYKFTVKSGQRIGFDIDRPSSSSLDSYLRIFTAGGTQLASNDNGQAPGESATKNSYIVRTFATGGTYYAAVSGKGNQNYDPKTGTGDTTGSTGPYTLYLTNRTPTATPAATVAMTAPAIKKQLTLDDDDDASQ